MSDSDSTETGGRHEPHDAGPDATAAFELLSNETRLDILLALWEAYDPPPPAGSAAVPFSALRERVSVRDSGQFNYHLNKLEGSYVRKTDGGYVLQPLGLKLVGTVIAGAGRDGTLERTEIHDDCDLCGAPHGADLRGRLAVPRLHRVRRRARRAPGVSAGRAVWGSCSRRRPSRTARPRRSSRPAC